MVTLTFWTRAFHGPEDFGANGFHYLGDGRGFTTSTASDVTSRMKHVAEIDVETGVKKQDICTSDMSQNGIFKGIKEYYKRPETQPTWSLKVDATEYKKIGLQTISYNLFMSGQNLAMPFNKTGIGLELAKNVVPPVTIYNYIAIWIDRKEDGNSHINFDGRVTGTAFPDHEYFVVDNADVSVFLGSHIRIGGAGPQLLAAKNAQLASGVATSVGAFNLTIPWTPEEKFRDGGVVCSLCVDYSYLTNIVDLKKRATYPTSIKTWNAIHEARNPNSRDRFIISNDGRYGVDPGIPASQMPEETPYGQQPEAVQPAPPFKYPENPVDNWLSRLLFDGGIVKEPQREE